MAPVGWIVASTHIFRFIQHLTWPISSLPATLTNGQNGDTSDRLQLLSNFLLLWKFQSVRVSIKRQAYDKSTCTCDECLLRKGNSISPFRLNAYICILHVGEAISTTIRLERPPCVYSSFWNGSALPFLTNQSRTPSQIINVLTTINYGPSLPLGRSLLRRRSQQRFPSPISTHFLFCCHVAFWRLWPAFKTSVCRHVSS